MKEQTQQRQAEETAFYRQQDLMLDAEEQRRRMMAEEEGKLVDQRKRLHLNNIIHSLIGDNGSIRTKVSLIKGSEI